MKKRKMSKTSGGGYYWFLFIVIVFLIVLWMWSFQFFKVTTPGQAECANTLTCAHDLSGEYVANNKGVYLGKQVIAPPQSDLPLESDKVLGAYDVNNKHIFVDLSKQTLYAMQGGKIVYQFLISSGKTNPTPVGRYKIWVKLRYTRMAGGDPARGTYYNLPNVPYTMFFYNDNVPKYLGYSIHGAYWHNNFGHPMSHGCVNMRIEDAQKMYDWADPPVTSSITYPTDATPATSITIFGTTPEI